MRVCRRKTSNSINSDVDDNTENYKSHVGDDTNEAFMSGIIRFAPFDTSS
jgi:hypothetical protein